MWDQRGCLPIHVPLGKATTYRGRDVLEEKGDGARRGSPPPSTPVGRGSEQRVRRRIRAPVDDEQHADRRSLRKNRKGAARSRSAHWRSLHLAKCYCESLLIVAARSNNVQAVKILAADVDVIDETDNEGWSALLNAAHKGHAEVTKILLENGAAVDLPDLMGWSPLMWAVYKCHPEVVDLLLQYGAHVNLIDEEDGLTPLIVAAGRGFTSIVERLIAADAQVNACDKFSSTALIWAARKGHLPIVQMLLNAGAEVDAVGMGSSTALMLATKGNYLGVVDLLLTREPNVNVVDQASRIAAREGYADICESLINSGAFVNQCDKYGNWILISAVRSGNASIVRMLLEKFADVNARDSENRTALHLAIDKSFMDIVYIILERKPNLELKNKDGETPLLRSVKSRHVALCELLVKAGAKISATDNNGDNALHYALRARSRRLTQTLLANPSDSRLLYRPNRLGQTPYSIDQGNPQPILPLIFGPIDADQQMDTMLGYDIYSNVLADIVCEPSLSLPLTIGLYAKWGSGKSILLAKLKDSMNSFSRNWLEGAHLT
ncbi:hypothetical protein KIN20_005533 [Parelaphostrongylus tenuis]|uniref:KAP NTPase domain-containing protein n=1 Tax=Parelaphostrongylus tenuis TaxID=148309 RepID=A0AAD5QG53_PARTN|nr:hypothetical protein KIN20_005533 [Parelaphostrongylus tenuis]